MVLVGNVLANGANGEDGVLASIFSSAGAGGGSGGGVLLDGLASTMAIPTARVACDGGDGGESTEGSTTWNSAGGGGGGGRVKLCGLQGRPPALSVAGGAFGLTSNTNGVPAEDGLAGTTDVATASGCTGMVASTCPVCSVGAVVCTSGYTVDAGVDGYVCMDFGTPFASSLDHAAQIGGCTLVSLAGSTAAVSAAFETTYNTCIVTTDSAGNLVELLLDDASQVVVFAACNAIAFDDGAKRKRSVAFVAVSTSAAPLGV